MYITQPKNGDVISTISLRIFRVDPYNPTHNTAVSLYTNGTAERQKDLTAYAGDFLINSFPYQLLIYR